MVIISYKETLRMVSSAGETIEEKDVTRKYNPLKIPSASSYISYNEKDMVRKRNPDPT